ncbi:MAG: sensor domain-containing diguanylate cyclase [Pseudomonadota bacterium]
MTEQAPLDGIAGAQVQTLKELARAALENQPTDAFLERVVSAIRRQFRWEHVGVATVEASRGVVVLQAFSTDLPSDLFVGHEQSMSIGIVGRVARTGLRVFEPATERSVDYVPTYEAVRAELCIPVIDDGQVLAVLNAETGQAEALNGQTEFLETVCDLIAQHFVARRRARALSEQATFLEVMNSVARLAMRSDQLSEMLRLTVDFMKERLPVSVATILMLSADGVRFEYEVCAGELGLHFPEDWPITVGVSGRCVRTGKPQLVTEVDKDPDYVPGNSDVRSEYLVPIAWGERVLGVLNLESVEPDTFTPMVQDLLRGIADQVAGLVHLLSVRTELEASNERFRTLSRVDGLTGAANRRAFDDAMAAAFASPESLCVAMLDVDHFKPLNDSHGHLYGDDCLVLIARQLRGELTDRSWTVARYGGEEFGVVMAGAAEEEAAQVMERIRRRIDELEIENLGARPAPRLTISVGIAERQATDETWQQLVHRADRALYAAKRRGRNRVISFPTEPSAQSDG